VYTRADVEAAVQSLAELLPGSVPTPRLQPPEVPWSCALTYSGAGRSHSILSAAILQSPREHSVFAPQTISCAAWLWPLNL